ncbi:MAG: adenylyltransferase/cytidyltransferase family protein [Chthoniobacterales bacterium]
MIEKVVEMEQLARRAKPLRDAGKKIVATNGCFDLLHLGHVRYLEAARKRGDVLIVGLNGDASVRELKGAGRPLNDERARAEVLAALECVDLVTIFSDVRATRFIELVKPDVYVKGGDYNSETLNAKEVAALEKIGAKIDIVPFVIGYSTSRLLEKLRDLPR